MSNAPTKTAEKASFQGINPHFVVPDVVASAEYYRDVFGFTIHGAFFEPPVFAIVGRDGVVIQFGRVDDGELVAPNRKRREEALDAYVWVDDVDALYAELKAKGAKILEEPVLRFYKCYELVVEDLNGYVLVFARDTATDRR